MTSSPTRTFVASYWKCLTLILGPNGFICGPALWSRRQRIGFRRIAARCLHKLSSLSARRERPTCRVSTADDSRFVSVFAHSLEHIGGYTPEGAKRAAQKLLPDVMSYDPTLPASFPSNGRTLTDDAGDVFVAVLTNGKVTEDKVGPHSDLLAEFPYVGPPHKAA